ncbi:MAG: alpha/beta hydrolase [Candidatus Binataceae bacterium]
MPTFTRGDVSINYEEYGSGFPLLLFAPGGMRSNIQFWHQSPFDPTRELADDFRVVAMDQRNAGQSRAPITAADGWDTYTSDHIALLDHLGIKRTHTLGGCIGSSYCLNLIKKAPDRVASAVLQNPIGLYNNRDAFYEMFDGWAKSMQRHQPNLSDAAAAEFRERMYGTDFVFNVDRDFVRKCTTPLLVLAGNDLYHPAPISREIAELAPNAEILLEWKTPEVVAATVERVRAFLKSNQ